MLLHLSDADGVGKARCEALGRLSRRRQRERAAILCLIGVFARCLQAFDQRDDLLGGEIVFRPTDDFSNSLGSAGSGRE